MPNRKWHRQITYDPSGVGSFFNFVFYQHVTPLGSLILGCANGCYKHVTPLGSLILGCTHGCYKHVTPLGSLILGCTHGCYKHVTPLGSLILGCTHGCYKHVTPLGSLILGCTHGCYNYATLRCRARYNNLMESIDKPALHVARPWKGRMLVENAYDKYILTPEGSYVNWK